DDGERHNGLLAAQPHDGALAKLLFNLSQRQVNRLVLLCSFVSHSSLPTAHNCARKLPPCSLRAPPQAATPSPPGSRGTAVTTRLTPETFGWGLRECGYCRVKTGIIHAHHRRRKGECKQKNRRHRRDRASSPSSGIAETFCGWRTRAAPQKN